MKNIKEFKNEFRLVCSDTWGDAMDAWLECAGWMNRKNMKIPNSWEYRAAPDPVYKGTNPESYWYEIFQSTHGKTLRQIGNLLFRYCQMLKYYKRDY